MLDTINIGKLAAEYYKAAITTRQGRAGRNVKGHAMTKHLHAAGQPKMNTKGIFAFPRGHSV